jgi:esterase
MPFLNPALLIRGGLSNYVSNEDVDAMRLLMPKMREHTIPEATHWVHADNPIELLKIVSVFA